MARIGGTCYFKVDGEQLSLMGDAEFPLNTKVREDMIGIDGSVDYKETSRAPYIKVTAKITADFPLDKIINGTNMTITLANANSIFYCLVNAHLSGEANFNSEDGTAELEFHGEEGLIQ